MGERAADDALRESEQSSPLRCWRPWRALCRGRSRCGSGDTPYAYGDQAVTPDAASRASARRRMRSSSVVGRSLRRTTGRGRRRRPTGSSPRAWSRCSSGWFCVSKLAATRETPSRCQRRSRGGTPRRKTGHPDPSPPEEWMHPGIARALTKEPVFPYDEPATRGIAGSAINEGHGEPDEYGRRRRAPRPSA